jgi:hypothetical protein
LRSARPIVIWRAVCVGLGSHRASSHLQRSYPHGSGNV